MLGVRKMRKRRKTYFILMIFALLLVACSQEKAEDNDEKSTNLDSKTKPKTEQEENTYPFTGINTDEAIDQRPVAVMVNNHPKARPQSGLSQADVVFEILAEGSITRFLAIYQSEEPEVVGPVRSAREYYSDLANGYDAIYVYHGAANFVEDMIQERGIENINGASYDNDGQVFKRESFRKAPHNSYLLFDAVNDIAEQKGYEAKTDVATLPFSENEADDIEGEPGEQVTIAYDSNWQVQYEYDEDDKHYYRSSDGEPTVELNTEEQIYADNVFIVEAQHEVIDDEGRRAIDFESGGNAYLMQKGKMQEVEWENVDGKMTPVKEGEPIGFVPGKTWVNVVPSSPGLDHSVSISSH